MSLIALGALAFWAGKIFLSLTKEIPDFGGIYSEGVIGQPGYINPLLSQNNEVDAAISDIIYSGLLRNDKNGQLVNDLADRYEISPDSKEYTFYIKRGVKWHDGLELTSNDIVFTINTLMNPLFKSSLRQDWQGVKVEKADDYTIKFILENPYFGFLENLTLGILPEHIWKNIDNEKFHLVKYNLEPIGSGPYKYASYNKDSDGNILNYKIDSFRDYFQGKSYIEEINFNFYANEQDLLDAYNRKKISGISNVSSQNGNLDILRKNTSLYEIKIPWSFSVFFNRNKSISLANKEIRLALDLATDKQQLIKDALAGKATILESPFFTGTEEFNTKIERNNFNLEKANKVLDEAKWEAGDDGIRSKNGVKMEFKLMTVDSPDLIKTAEILKEQWKKIGANVDIEALDFSDIQQNYIKPREYDAILVGQDSSFNVDPYSFWHSSQKKDPGLNLALFDDARADKLIEEARAEANKEERKNKYYEFQEIIKDQVPAVFLFSPYYLYVVDNKIKGIEIENINSSQFRFSNINNLGIWDIRNVGSL
ncbi:MAG: Extracellular solute-binding protein [Candidatus Moranbacteria bacterium GW2011_GWF2_35_54]|nr:MAG: Extracellular solute-binding protein [Candidatus Moranbacteria bacterium GW2011_GWF2_35_54]